LGIGDWGLGIGDWGLGIGANPQSPIPNAYPRIKVNYIYYLKNNYSIIKNIIIFISL